MNDLEAIFLVAEYFLVHILTINLKSTPTYLINLNMWCAGIALCIVGP